MEKQNWNRMDKILQVKEVSKTFGGVKALDSCSFEVRRGTITALIGPNGSGKSTLFNIISGVMNADSGKIIFDGNDITNRSPEDISNSGISRMFQQSRLFKNLTVKDNLMLAIDNEDMKFWKNVLGKNKITKEKEDKVKKMLKHIGMEEFEHKTARNLSFGQKRLVELARTILNPHTLLMLDEPVAGVNPRLRKTIVKVLLKSKKEGKTVLLIEHDMNFILGISDEVIVLDEGKVIAKGTPKEIKNNSKVLEAYLGE
jgi:branched-chain amino acid transport system ATP-binding protein